jgi:hypothetical protein
VDGNHIVYHYLEKDLRDRDIWLFQMRAARLFTALGIWFSPKTYSACPILLPFAVRDPSCRKRKPGDVEAWGMPNAAGYFRDDNSLIKGLPRSLRIKSPGNPLYDGRSVGDGFVAAHVWREIDDSTAKLSSRDPVTNSFVPNLVSLPNQVAKLTDREGSFAQTYLQALSAKIYRHTPVLAPLKSLAESAWAKLPIPSGVPENGLPDVAELAFFEDREEFVCRRRDAVAAVVVALRAVRDGSPLSKTVISKRYAEGLPSVKPTELETLLGVLLPHVAGLSG